jgi:transmembrane sensor
MMPAVATPPARTPLLADQAVHWLLLLRSEHVDETDMAAFAAWRRADSRHEKAWQDLAAGLGHSFGRLAEHYPPPPALDARVASGGRPMQWRRRFLQSAVGGLSLAGIAAAVNLRYPLEGIDADHVTATRQRRHVALQDGSRLLLDARSVVDIDFSDRARTIHLREGAIRAVVAPDAHRPFEVHTAEGTVRALGTDYMVRQEVRRSLVAVHEHAVDVVTRSGARATVSAGVGARFDAAMVDQPRDALIDEAAWEHGMVTVRGRPLADIVSALRPYHYGMLRISAAAGAVRVSGTFSLDDPQATLALLADALPITLTEYTPLIVLIERRTA